ncbi:MAG: hypothetical protein MJ252_03140 [archaeon]|nr:hypothetical protein [archaeon]
MEGFSFYGDKDVDVQIGGGSNLNTNNNYDNPPPDKNEISSLDNKNKNNPTLIPVKSEPSLKENKQKEDDYETLDESIADSLKRDLLRIYSKLKVVLIPKFSASKKEELHNWDLWGPLIICLLLCM